MLDETAARALLNLLDVTLSAWVPVSAVTGGSAYGVRLTLRPGSGSTTVRTVYGRVHLDGPAVEVTG